MSAGVLSQISLAKESTWGTAVTPTKSIIVRPTGGFKIDLDKKLLPGIRAQLQKNVAVVPGLTKYEGEYTMDAYADYIGYFILSAMGVDTPATHAGESIVYDHVFTEAATKPSLTIEEAISEHCRRYAGCIATGFKISAKKGEPIEFTPKLLGKSQATSTQITGAYSTVASLYHSQGIVKIGGSTLNEVESFELEYSNGLEMVYSLGSVNPVFNSIKGGSEVKGKIELYLDSTSLTRLTNYLANTNEAVEFIATGGTIGSAANYVLDALVPTAVYKMADTPITDGHNLLTIYFETIPDSTPKILALTLTNLLASY